MLIFVIDDWGISCENIFRCMSLDIADDKSTLVQVMAWCRNKPLPGRGRHWNFDPLQCLGPRPEILDRYISLSCLRWLPTACHERIFIGLSGSRDWSHGESHGPDGPMPAAILENFHCEQPCYGFLGLLKFLCFQTVPNLVNCFLIIFSLVWHPKDFAQIKITHGKNASNPSNRKAIVKKLQPLFNILPLNTPWQLSELCA